MNRLMRADQGLPRRFAHSIHLEDYTAAELASIARGCASEKYKLEFESDSLEARVAFLIEDQYALRMETENATLAMRLLEDAVRRRGIRRNTAKKLLAAAGEAAEVELFDGLIAEDFGIVEASVDVHAELKQKIEEKIQDLVGMEAGKAFFDKMRRNVAYRLATGNSKLVQEKSWNMVIMGPAGVGKTTLARLIAEFLFAYNITSSNHFVEKNGLDLKGQAVGQTAPKVQEAFADAKGGCLFIGGLCS